MTAGDFHLPEVAIAAVCRRHRIKRLALFGSAARGDMRPDSDIDLLVEFLPEARVGLLEHFAAEREFSELLGHRVDLVSKRALRQSIQAEILPELKPIYEA